MQVNPTLVPIMMTKDTYRVPVWVNVQDDLYTICVATDQYRHYTGDTVPGQIKSSLTMVRAFPEEVRMLQFSHDSHFSLVMACPNYQLREIGWQIDDCTYVLILPNELLRWMYISG